MGAVANKSLRDLAADFRALLATAQEERAARPDIVTVDGETECAWVFYERTTMHDEVNRVRAETGLTPLPIAAVARVERMAAGHVDYTLKYAFYCAELAQGYGDFPNR
jgi:hypothetical protein